jgi:hypothetical protein
LSGRALRRFARIAVVYASRKLRVMTVDDATG